MAAGHIFRKLTYLLDVLLMALILWMAMNAPLVIYGIDQGRGQLNIVMHSVEVDDVLSDPKVPDSIKAKLRFIEDVKKFAIDSLGLKGTKNYTTYFDQQGRPLLWVLTASDRFALKAYEWKFPLLGSVSYKGYFDYR